MRTFLDGWLLVNGTVLEYIILKEGWKWLKVRHTSTLTRTVRCCAHYRAISPSADNEWEVLESLSIDESQYIYKRYGSPYTSALLFTHATATFTFYVTTNLTQFQGDESDGKNNNNKNSDPPAQRHELCELLCQVGHLFRTFFCKLPRGQGRSCSHPKTCKVNVFCVITAFNRIQTKSSPISKSNLALQYVLNCVSSKEFRPQTNRESTTQHHIIE